MSESQASSGAIRYQSIRKRIDSEHVVLVAVSKNQTADAIEELYRLGQRDFGENYVQELIEKAVELEQRGCLGIRWHFIGHLQTNKIKMIIPFVFCVHAVDTLKVAAELSKRWIASGRQGQFPVFIQVNIDEESSKSGILPAELPAQMNELSRFVGLSYQGLMCIPDPAVHPQAAFARLRDLEKKCRPITQGKLSMGMSDDFEIAIQEGATHVRIGTALFGPRAPKAESTI